VGRLTLNRNPDNFHAETEQVAFCPSHVVPGIDFTDDPLLQGRLFSYLDTQLSRLGGPNFQEIPINRPLVPVHNNQRDGHMQQSVYRGRTSYFPNSLGGGCPFQSARGLVSFPERTSGTKIRERSSKFFDHFSQAAMFYNSQTPPEQAHIVSALQFELSKVETEAIRVRMVGVLAHIDHSLAQRVAQPLGVSVPDIKQQKKEQLNHMVPAGADASTYQPTAPTAMQPSPALSIEHTISSAKTRKIGVVVAEGFDGSLFDALRSGLFQAGASVVVIAPHLGAVRNSKGESVKVDQPLFSSDSVLFDGLCVLGGADPKTALQPVVMRFLEDTFRHCKPLSLAAAVAPLAAGSLSPLGAALKAAASGTTQRGLVILTDASAVPLFVKSAGERRVWERETR